MLVEAIEPRILHSADISPLQLTEDASEGVAEMRYLDGNGEFIHETSTQQQEESRELIFVDTSTPDYQSLVDHIVSGSNDQDQYEIVLMDSESDGLDTITDTLASRNDLSAVHIISHGSDGNVELGSTNLTNELLAQRAGDVASWADAFTGSGDILIYGCNLAATEVGQDLVDDLAVLTRTDVAASDDLTGHASLGGDWDLEYQFGDIEAAVAPSAELQNRYQHVLAVINGTAGDDVLMGTAGDDVITADAGNDVLIGSGGSDQLLGEAGADMFRFTDAKDGDVYTVDGGTENDTIDLTEFGSGTVSDDGATITVDLGDGESFTINYSNIENVITADTAGNHGPDANAGPDQTVAENTTVTLDATASDDFDGHALTYQWTQLAGPAVTLSNAAVAQPTFTSPSVASETSLTFEVVVSDGSTSHVDIVEVTVLPAVDGTGGADSLIGTADGEVLRGLAGNDTLDGAGGDDVLAGGAGDDSLTGGMGTDIADYSDAGSGVTVDLTITTAQNTGGGGTDTLSGIEGVIGSNSTDTFVFSNPQNGAIYTVDGNGGLNDTIDLSGYASTAVTFANGTLTVDMGGGQSFTVRYVDVSLINFSDTTATVLTNDIAVANWSGSGILIDGAEAFRLDLSGGGTINWSYDRGSDTLTVSNTTGTGSGTALTIEDLNGKDLRIDQIAVSTDLGSITSDANIGTLTMMGDTNITTVTIGGGQGTIGLIDGQGKLLTDMTVNADVTTINILENQAVLTINGDVETFDVDRFVAGSVITVNGNVGNFINSGSADIVGDLTISEDLGSLIIGKLQADGSLTVGGNLGSWIGTDVESPVVIGGDVGTMSFDKVRSDITISGDLESATINTVDAAVTITANQVVGTLVFDVGGTDYGGTYPTPVTYVYDGSTGVSVIYPEVPVQLNNAGLTVDEGSTTVITNSHLNYSDAQQPAASVTYTVTTAPSNGQLELTTNPNVAITSFTQDDIDNSRVVYVHDGSETATDSFAFTVDDGQDNYASGPSVVGIGTLTNVTSGISEARAPDYSPDGSQIVFSRNNDIYIMDVDGSNQTLLTSSPGGDFQAVWSPDGSKIAFTSNRDGNNEIYVINVDGSNEINITSHAANDGAPGWSPDSSKIAFTSDRDGDTDLQHGC
jgi:Ca2+-binding RTX toxin-like protein